ncbi:DUF5360 family protein [Nocardia amikacinitolerans]|uniref:DUF5360 family protein n=1 Tax=Nocardia amikacinitolerans TaxID=756689 RepID=UPI0036AF6C64
MVVARRQPPPAERMMLVSLTATAAAGLMALKFSLASCEFDLAWWIPNAWLPLFPMVAMTTMMVTSTERDRVPYAG